ncbi:MAG: Coenzyme F420 hydrogenase/dehydrogenase, beta subunit C-terminal domain [Bacteroidaceae bacterium]|nr:Coenzyme F420 hydrogenase/dehydrogenase, beta subunit C-terminal domain [Bacteroidaceae bacterium]
MINIQDRRDCCGCTACASICAHNAISMEPDAMGFKYPVVDDSKCVDCGLCEKVCAFNENYDKSLNLQEPLAYGVRHKDMNEVATSRSGAAFIAISDWVLDNGGVVYGAGYTGHFQVVHKRATTKEARNEFKGSKYVQSDMNDVFRQVRTDLKAGLKVLFSGTPCQVAGLASFVGKKQRENLYLVDIVCHGVPAPNIWHDYLAYVEKKYNDTAIAVDFRDKTELGWAAHRESFTFTSGKVHRNTYTYLFYEHIMFRPSCERCHYTNLYRPSDITIADFWGWEKTDNTINTDDKGISLVFCNTSKGSDLCSVIKDSVNYVPVKLVDCLQPNLQHPSIMHRDCADFECRYKKHGFLHIAKRYGDLGWRYVLRRFVQKSRTAIRLLTIR